MSSREVTIFIFVFIYFVFLMQCNIISMEDQKKVLQEKFEKASLAIDHMEYALDLAEIYERENNDNMALEWYQAVLDVIVHAWHTEAMQQKQDKAKQKIEKIRKKIIGKFKNTVQQYLNLSPNDLIQKLQDIYMHPNQYTQITYMLSELKIRAAYEIAKIYKQEKNENKMFEWYGKAVEIHLKHFYALQQKIINILKEEARKFLKKGNLDEAIKIYKYGKQELEINQTEKLKEQQKNFLKAINAMKEERYQEAQEIFKKLIENKGLGIVQPFFEEALTKLKEQEQSKKKIKIPEWIRVAQKDVLNNMPLKKDWRIENNWIEIQTEIEVQLLGMILADLMEDQFNDDLPCLIIIAQTSQNLLVFDMLVFAENVVKAKSMNFGPYNNIENAFVFVIDKTDDTFSFIKKISNNSDAYTFFDPIIQKAERRIIAKKDQGSTVPDISYDTLVSFEAKKSWTTPGEAQDEVAKLFELNAQETNIEKEKKQYLELASRWRMHGSKLQPPEKELPKEEKAGSFELQESLVALANTLRQLKAKL